MFKRLVITVLNVLFPPLAIALLCGAGEDLLINSVLFLLAIIPSHVHGFYISLTYFNRKRKVRKGVYPGNRRPFIYSDKIQNGGASRKEIERLKKEKEYGKAEKRASRRIGGGNGSPVDDSDDGNQQRLSRTSTLRNSARVSRYNTPADDYEVQQIASRRSSRRVF